MLESFSLDRYYSEKLLQLFANFPIISDLIQQEPINLKQVFQFCRFFKYLPREAIIERGTYSPWLFYLLDGECWLLDDDNRQAPVESIKTGQLFGELDLVFDATGQQTVLAGPGTQEITLLGIDCSVFMIQTAVRLLDDSTRIAFFQALLGSLLTRYTQIAGMLNKTTDKNRIPAFEPFTFQGAAGSKEQLIFFDMETKRLAMVINALRFHLLDAAKKGGVNLTEMNTFVTNRKLKKQELYDYTHELPYKPGLTKEEAGTTTERHQTEVKKTEQKSVCAMHELSFLVVDDDDHHRDSAVNILKELGAEKIHVERNGQAAWNYICSHPSGIDVVLCDWIMPEKTGLDLYNSIQEAAGHLQEIVFIMLTSIESKTSVLEAVENGVHGYVIKPVNQKSILQQIQQALKHVRGAVLKT